MDLDLERVNTATRFSDLYPLFKTISARITNFANIFDFNTAAGIGVVAVGSVWIANQQYLSTPQGTVDASLLTDRKKVLVIGNSIPGYSKLVQNNATNYYWEADGFISWLRAFTKNGFDLVRTAVTTFPTLNAHTGTIDRLGVYSCPGGVALNMLSDIAQIADCCIDQPNVIYLCNIFENDIGNTPLSTLQLQANQIILAVRGKFPKAVIILSQPSPSNSYSAGSVADYVALKAYIAALINSYPNLVTETNSATTTAILRPIASYTTDGIHPTERGALVRARAAFAELGFMFQPLSVPEQEVGNYTVNPTLSLTGFQSTRPRGARRPFRINTFYGQIQSTFILPILILLGMKLTQLY